MYGGSGQGVVAGWGHSVTPLVLGEQSTVSSPRGRMVLLCGLLESQYGGGHWLIKVSGASVTRQAALR